MNSEDAAGKPIAFRVRRSGRARRVLISVRLDRGVEVILPAGARMSRAEIAALVEGRRGWIERAAARLRAGDQRSLEPPRSVPYRGVPLRLAIRLRPGAAAVRLKEGAIEIDVPDERLVHAALKAWGRGRASALLTEAANRWADRLGLRFQRPRIGDARSRWGSCSSRGTLTFSWRAILMPLPVFEYLVLHEVAHLAHPNHGAGFWRFVAAHCPDQQLHRRWLRENGDTLRF